MLPTMKPIPLSARFYRAARKRLEENRPDKVWRRSGAAVTALHKYLLAFEARRGSRPYRIALSLVSHLTPLTSYR
jgi:hypothetical protein